MIKYLFILTAFLIANNNLKSITGAVSDNSGYPIENVEITTFNSSHGTVTGKEGFFLILFDVNIFINRELYF